MSSNSNKKSSESSGTKASLIVKPSSGKSSKNKSSSSSSSKTSSRSSDSKNLNSKIIVEEVTEVPIKLNASTSHADTSHASTSHADTSHADTSHTDTSHTDTSHASHRKKSSRCGCHRNCHCTETKCSCRKPKHCPCVSKFPVTTCFPVNNPCRPITVTDLFKIFKFCDTSTETKNITKEILSQIAGLPDHISRIFWPEFTQHPYINDVNHPCDRCSCGKLEDSCNCVIVDYTAEEKYLYINTFQFKVLKINRNSEFVCSPFGKCTVPSALSISEYANFTIYAYKNVETDCDEPEPAQSKESCLIPVIPESTIAIFNCKGIWKCESVACRDHCSEYQSVKYYISLLESSLVHDIGSNVSEGWSFFKSSKFSHFMFNMTPQRLSYMESIETCPS